ncbi:hypothetical protein B0H14DRAFT_2591640 [Mycena olivaceomarginata]|nr:hypothetical protein B0H14DRAFT_2591640 [Mycena olivaceomarginata]
MASIDLDKHNEPSPLKQAKWLKKSKFILMKFPNTIDLYQQCSAPRGGKGHLRKYQPLATKAKHDPAVKHASPEETSENGGFATSPLEILPRFIQPSSGNHALNPALLLEGKLFQGKFGNILTHPSYVEEHSLIGDGSFPFLQNLIKEHVPAQVAEGAAKDGVEDRQTDGGQWRGCGQGGGQRGQSQGS